jgi:hypothetical protein
MLSVNPSSLPSQVNGIFQTVHPRATALLPGRSRQRFGFGNGSIDPIRNEIHVTE